MTNPPFSMDDLHALVDRQLPPEQAAALERQLEGDATMAARVAAWRAQREALHGGFDAVLTESIPRRLQQANRRRPRNLLAATAAVGWLALGAIIGWGAHGWRGATNDALTDLPRRAAIAHAVYAPEVRHPVEVSAAEHDHLVAWLSKRLGVRLKVPNLDAQGFRLVGGRLLPGINAGQPVAQFMYQDASGRRLTLYVRSDAQASHDTAFRFAAEQNISVFYWVDGQFGYALSAELERAELLKLAEVIYGKLNR